MTVKNFLHIKFNGIESYQLNDLKNVLRSQFLIILFEINFKNFKSELVYLYNLKFLRLQFLSIKI